MVASREPDAPQRVRLDRWLWAARFFKTRSLAAQATAGGKVHLNGERVKRAKMVQLGDEVRIRKGTDEFVVIVQALSERRGPPADAARLYAETPESQATRERLAAQRRSEPSFEFKGKGRPTKKERRRLDQWKRRG